MNEVAFDRNASCFTVEFEEAVSSLMVQSYEQSFKELSVSTGIEYQALIHYALVRWMQAGSEALMAVTPQILNELYKARQEEDWIRVAGIIDWLQSGRSDDVSRDQGVGRSQVLVPDLDHGSGDAGPEDRGVDQQNEGDGPDGGHHSVEVLP